MCTDGSVEWLILNCFVAQFWLIFLSIAAMAWIRFLDSRKAKLGAEAKV
jgi:hypothetical protein